MISAQELDQGMVILKTIWYALAGSLVLYVITIPLLVGDGTANFPAELYGELQTTLHIAAGLTLIASWLARRQILATRTPPKPSRSRQHPAVQRYTTAMIIGLALAEVVAIYGLILFLLGKNLADLLLPVTFAAAAMATYFPQKTDLIELAKKFTRGN